MSWVANSGAKMAITATARITVPPNITDGLERSARHDSQSCCARACHDDVGTGSLSQADSETERDTLSDMGPQRVRGSKTRYSRSQTMLMPMKITPIRMVQPTTAFMSPASSALVR